MSVRNCVQTGALLTSKGLAHCSQDGCTPLHYAAYGGQVANVEALVKAGASAEAVNGAERTPAQEAEVNEQTGVIAALGAAA